jgi:hypothetical protein
MSGMLGHLFNQFQGVVLLLQKLIAKNERLLAVAMPG